MILSFVLMAVLGGACFVLVACMHACRFRPTLGVAIVFRADTAPGTLNVWCEGNMEGTD